jgi:hypothetical protein
MDVLPLFCLHKIQYFLPHKTLQVVRYILLLARYFLQGDFDAIFKGGKIASYNVRNMVHKNHNRIQLVNNVEYFRAASLVFPQNFRETQIYSLSICVFAGLIQNHPRFISCTGATTLVASQVDLQQSQVH